MAYYQAQDADGRPFEYSRPIVSYEEPPRKRAVGGPVVLLLLCAVVGLAVHSSLASGAAEPVMAAVAGGHNNSNENSITNTSSLSATTKKPQGTRNPQREQGLEDIEDNDSTDKDVHTHNHPPPSSHHLHHHNDHHHAHKKHLPHSGPVTPSYLSSSSSASSTTDAFTLAVEEENNNDNEKEGFSTCVQKSCNVAMKAVATANPSGSALLNCLSASADDNAATTCWGPSNPNEDANKDPEQTLRVCAICNACIPGSVDQHLCDAPPRSWNDILGAPGGVPADTTNAAAVGEGESEGEIDAPYHQRHEITASPDTPVGRYEADKHHRENVPVTNSSKNKRRAAKPWIPLMSGGRQNAINNGSNDDGSDNGTVPLHHHGVIPMLSLVEPTNFARTSHHSHSDSKHHSHSKHHAHDSEHLPQPFWAKFVNGNSASGQAPWAGYTNFVDATNLAASSSSSSSPNNDYAKYEDKYASQYTGGKGGEPASSSSSHHHHHHGRKSAPPTNMWDKYNNGGSRPTAAFDTEELAVDSRSSSKHSSSGSGSSAAFPPPAQPVDPTWPYPAIPWEDRYNGQAVPPPAPVINMETDGDVADVEEEDDEEAVEEEVEEVEPTELSVDAQSTPVSPWSKYSAQGGSSGSNHGRKGSKEGNPWDKYMSQGANQGGGNSNMPVSAYDTTELSVDGEVDKEEIKKMKSTQPVHNHFSPPAEPKHKKKNPEPSNIDPVPVQSAAASSSSHDSEKEASDKHESKRHSKDPVSPNAPPASRPIGSGPNTPYYQGGAPATTPMAPTPATNMWGPYTTTNGGGGSSRGVVATTVADDADELEDEMSTTTDLSVSNDFPHTHPAADSHHKHTDADLAAERKAAERKADDKAHDRKAAERKADEKADDRKAAEKRADEKADERRAAEKKAAEKKADHRKASVRKAAVRKADDRKAAEKKAEEKAHEKRVAEKEAEEKADERRAAEKRAEEKAHEKRVAEKKAERQDLIRCYQMGCGPQIGQAAQAQSPAFTCLSKADGVREAEKCLGHEDPKSPSDPLRTCMICHKCIDGSLKHHSAACENFAQPSWSNYGGGSWSP